MKRALRIVKFTMLGLLAVVSAGLLWLAIANARLNGRLQAEIQQLRDQNLPTCLADLERAPPPPDQNAATFLRRAQAGVEAIRKQIHQAHVDHILSDADSNALDQGQLTPAMEKVLRAAFSDHADVPGLLAQAAECPEFVWQFDCFEKSSPANPTTAAYQQELIDLVDFERIAFRLMNYRTLLLLSEGKTPEARQTVETMLRLANRLHDESMLVNYLIGSALLSMSSESANRVLRADELPAEASATLEQTLANIDPAEAFQQSLINERAFSLQVLEEARARGRPLIAMLPAFNALGLRSLRQYDKLAETAQRPLDAELQAELRSQEEDNSLTPSIAIVRVVLARSLAKLRSLRVLNQLLLQDPRGEKDLKIESLGLPPEATIDPFDGQPLRIKHSDAGWTVYSVGKDLVDNGGQLDDEETDIGLGPSDSDG